MAYAMNVGKLGENTVCDYLTDKGLSVLTRNFKRKLPYGKYGKYGEVDIIAKNGNILDFIEVKTRAIGSLSGMYAVDSRKQNRIVEASRRYIDENTEIQYDEVRYSVVEVGTTSDGGQVVSLKYTENAFQAWN
ncbi:MAG: YraN family protein [Oscillospiraceae bacterium]|jgi:putative endonuclease|nr:YraN family protein [Oscillospiraceae bacterium]